MVNRRFDIVAIIVFVIWLGVDLTSRTVFGPVAWPDCVVDYRIMYDASSQLIETDTYPAGYPYPPPGVAAHAATTVLPFPIAATFWLVATGVVTLACYFTLARMLGLLHRPGTLILLPIAHTAAAYYFQWEFRSLNCNVFVLTAVLFGASALTRGRDARAGFWFAAAVALKFLPILLLPYLLWVRRPRSFGWAVAWSAVFWIGVPLLAFDPEGFRSVYSGWYGELTRATDAGQIHHHPILISLSKAAAYAMGEGTHAAQAMVLSVCAAWVLVGLAGAVRCRREDATHDAGVLTDVSLLILGPAAVSPYLEAYHVVAACVPAAVLAVFAATPGNTPRMRMAAGLALALAAVLATVKSAWVFRGLMVNIQLLVLCATAVLVNWPLRRHSTTTITSDPLAVPLRSAA